ncbi:MAG TPA: hypothetical protein VF220_03885 [Nitrososphaeraceae archaeon]
MKFSVVLILFQVIIFGTMLSALWINFEAHTVFARCPNGYHRSPSGDCEKYTLHEKGLARCPNGYHTSPDGDCEKVSESDSSSSSKNNDKSSAESNSDSTSSEDIIL